MYVYRLWLFYHNMICFLYVCVCIMKRWVISLQGISVGCPSVWTFMYTRSSNFFLILPFSKLNGNIFYLCTVLKVTKVQSYENLVNTRRSDDFVNELTFHSEGYFALQLNFFFFFNFAILRHQHLKHKNRVQSDFQSFYM